MHHSILPMCRARELNVARGAYIKNAAMVYIGANPLSDSGLPEAPGASREGPELPVVRPFLGQEFIRAARR